MRVSSRIWRRVAIGLGALGLALAALAVALDFWIIPALVIGRLERIHGGKVTIGGWWINARSSGVRNAELHETNAETSPVWAHARSVSTDLSWRRLLSGQTTPRRITLHDPQVTLRYDEHGSLLTRPLFHAARGGGGPSARLSAENARIILSRRGDATPMVVSGIKANVDPSQASATLSATTEDPAWGAWIASGRANPSFSGGSISLIGRQVADVAAKLRRVPFVPTEVSDHFEPKGPIDVVVAMRWSSQEPLSAKTTVSLRETTVRLPTLGLTTEHTTGKMVINGPVVHVSGMSGRALGGTVDAQGTLDFGRDPPLIDLTLNLRQIDVARTPPSWQLAEAAITGRLSGKTHLRVALTPDGPDLSGSSGDAVIEGGTLQGIPVKSLRLSMKAQGQDLRYESGEATGASIEAVSGLIMVAFQDRAAPTPAQRKGVVLPKSLSTHIELEDVNLTEIVARGEALGVHLPFALGGKASLKADATIPLGALKDVKGYAFHGDLTLKSAHIRGVDFGNLTGHLDLKDGLLVLKDLRGQLVERPAGAPWNRARATPPVPAEGPLPPGGFRADVRVPISPPGRLSARFEGNRLPVTEVLAPFLPWPTPVSGRLSLNAEAAADVASLADPRTWVVKGRAEGAMIRFRATTLDSFSSTVSLRDGHLDVPDLAARLGGKPLHARMGLDVARPYAVEGEVQVAGWEIADLLAFVPGTPRPAPASGVVTGKAVVSGTLAPLKLQSHGDLHVAALRAGPVPLGDVPLKWTTKGDTIVVEGVEVRPFGGQLTLNADLPTTGDRPILGRARFSDVDLAQMSAALPEGGLKLAGKAAGSVDFRVPPGASALEATASLTAPELSVQGIPADGLDASISARAGVADYDLSAKSLGGRVRFRGNYPLNATPGSNEANARLRFAGFKLSELWRAWKVRGALAGLEGLAAIDTNLRADRRGTNLRAHGIAEVRDLRWGVNEPLGGLRGEFVLTPEEWRVEHLTGELFTGPASGEVWGDISKPGVDRIRFEARVDHASLPRIAAFQPKLARYFEGTGNLRMSGRFEEALRAEGDVFVPRAKLYGMPVTELHVPAELSYNPATGVGVLEVRRLTTRFAGGQVRSDARFHFGGNSAFSSDIQIAALDLETLVRLLSEARRPAGGKLSGRVTLSGVDPEDLKTLRGKLDLDLEDASLVELPVFRELDRLLGAARGGIFNTGDFRGIIADRRILIEEFTLEGRLAQVHASGSVGFDGRLDVVAIVNSNQMISQTGQSLVALVPGLRGLEGRSAEATSTFARFLSNRLLKTRITGTLANPQVNVDPGVVVSAAAASFFGAVLRLPAGLLR